MATKYDAWLGKTRQTNALIDPWNAKALANVLDVNGPDASHLNNDEPLPSLWHWLYFLETAPKSRLGDDGHPVTGDFLPAIDNPRRMFAGGRTRYHQPLVIGQQAQLVETVANIQQKTGGSGEIVIVTVAYDYSQNGILCIREERDFIYLPAVVVSAPPKPLDPSVTAIEAADWSIDFTTNSTTLFRFSALTFNSHRIHYDAEYARNQEGYAALVVHGPLTAILLSECVRKHGSRGIKSFSFRAMSPLFCGQTVRIRAEHSSADEITVIAYTPAGAVAVKATVVLT